MKALLPLEQLGRTADKTDRIYKRSAIEFHSPIDLLLLFIGDQRQNEGLRSLLMSRFGNSSRVVLSYGMAQDDEIELPLGDKLQRCGSRGTQHIRACLTQDLGASPEKIEIFSHGKDS
jgi:hypothetical protein